MSMCRFCDQEMLETTGCTVDLLPIGPVLYQRLLYGEEQLHSFVPAEVTRCHDCGVLPGEYHHPGCDMEECPRCHEQFISCPCGRPLDA